MLYKAKLVNYYGKLLDEEHSVQDAAPVYDIWRTNKMNEPMMRQLYAIHNDEYIEDENQFEEFCFQHWVDTELTEGTVSEYVNDLLSKQKYINENTNNS